MEGCWGGFFNLLDAQGPGSNVVVIFSRPSTVGAIVSERRMSKGVYVIGREGR